MTDTTETAPTPKETLRQLKRESRRLRKACWLLLFTDLTLGFGLLLRYALERFAL